MSVVPSPAPLAAGNGQAAPTPPAAGEAAPAGAAGPANTESEAPREVCPLCGGPLRAEQDWCLRCGAAARTRLAAPPRWKPLVISLLTIAVVALGVLVAALVKLAG
jgi:rRNA maturation protein Nop10